MPAEDEVSFARM